MLLNSIKILFQNVSEPKRFFFLKKSNEEIDYSRIEKIVFNFSIKINANNSFVKNKVFKGTIAKMFTVPQIKSIQLYF